MTVHHVLDTGALYVLLKKHKPKLWMTLSAAAEDSIWIPALVLSEAAQADALEKKRLEKVFAIADVEPLNEQVAARAAEALRAVTREKCDG
jgi:hypothetical protein